MDISTETSNKICLLVSTLIKVTEQLLSSANNLQKNVNSDGSTQQHHLQSVMEHYDRLNTVMKVLKIAYPIQTNENNVVNTTVKNVTTRINQNSPSLPSIKPTTEPRSEPIIKVNQSLPPSKSENTQPPALAPPPAPPPPQQQQPQQQQPPPQQPPPQQPPPQQPPPQQQRQERIRPIKNISSTVFLDQFEKTAHEFAAQHNIGMEQIWESLLVHALPKDKIAWAEKTILYKNLDWNTARKYYLNAYPDNKPQPPPTTTTTTTTVVKTVTNSKKHSVMPDLVKTTELAHISSPSNIPNDDSEQTRERQSRYAEYLLSIEMKEYDSITEFNSKFYRYASIACMNLYDVSLSRRYVSSLLPKYRLSVERAVQQNSPASLKETMELASSVILPIEKARKSNGESCWKHPDIIKRNHLEDNTRALKRFCA